MEDKISDLPDSILHHILSFLPTKEVVATSLLSKRWRSLWPAMPTFDFDDTEFSCSLDDFFQFVDAVFILADWRPTEKFRLICGLSEDLYDRKKMIRINVWINSLVNRKVEHLEVRFKMFFMPVTTTRIFNCGTIRVLKLEGVRLNTFDSVNLPLLRVMHFVEVELSDFGSLGNLLSTCHLLQDLVLYLDVWTDDVTLDVGKLQHLVSATVAFNLIKWEAFTNVTFLGLNTATLHGHDFPRFENLTSLEFSCLRREELNWMGEGLRNCPKLEILVIHQIFTRHDDDDEEKDGEGRWMDLMLDIPQCLLSHLKEFSLGGYQGSEWEFELARCIMENARVLRTISIHCDDIINADQKYQSLNMLASCCRRSAHCKLFFN